MKIILFFYKLNNNNIVKDLCTNIFCYLNIPYYLFYLKAFLILLMKHRWNLAESR